MDGVDVSKPDSDVEQTRIEAPRSAKKQIDVAELMQRFGAVFILITILVIAVSMSNVFLTERNIMNVLQQISESSLMSIGMLFVILTGGIDLSVGSVAALGSVLSALILENYAPGVAVGLSLVAGGACGLFSGLLVAYVRLPPFVTTLAMMSIARGLALMASEGQPILMGGNGAVIVNFGTGALFGIPYPVLLMFVAFVVAGAVFGFTRFGRMVKAVGSNAEAVRLSGVPVSRYIIAVYAISGVLAAAAGVISTSRTGIGSATVGVGSELTAIAAVVIGGASLMGGRGGAANTFIGVFVLGVINDLMNLANVPGYRQQVFMGAIIIGAMLLQYGSRFFRR